MPLLEQNLEAVEALANEYVVDGSLQFIVTRGSSPSMPMLEQNLGTAKVPVNEGFGDRVFNSRLLADQPH